MSLYRKVSVAINIAAALACFVSAGTILHGYQMTQGGQAFAVGALGLAALVEALRTMRGEP